MPTYLGALCARWDPELWFSDDPDDINEAKAICRGCPALDTCLQGAVDRKEELGVWGAQLFRKGRPTKWMPRPPKAPCGTYNAYRRHLRKNEPIDDACSRFRPERRPLPPIEHGTNNGYWQHRNRREQPCETCLAAHAEYNRAEYARKNAS